MAATVRGEVARDRESPFSSRESSRIQDLPKIEAPADRKLYEKTDLLIIDEASMLRCDLVDAIDAFLRKTRRNDQPFGGVQVLLLGDLFQLPPVVTRTEWDVLDYKGYASQYFFSAFSLRDMEMLHVELGHVYRQTDPLFISLLNKLRVAEDTEEVVREVNARCGNSEDGRDAITLTCTNKVADRINDTAMASLQSEERLFVGEIEGKFRLDEDRLPSPMDLRLKSGAQVMFTKNDEQKRWVNGSLGVVRALDDDAISVETGDGLIHEVDQVSWENYEYVLEADKIIAREVGKYTQYPPA